MKSLLTVILLGIFLGGAYWLGRSATEQSFTLSLKACRDSLQIFKQSNSRLLAVRDSLVHVQQEKNGQSKKLAKPTSAMKRQNATERH